MDNEQKVWDWSYIKYARLDSVIGEQVEARIHGRWRKVTIVAITCQQVWAYDDSYQRYWVDFDQVRDLLS